MALDQASGTLYITELNGHVAAIAVAAEAHDPGAGLLPTLLNISARGRVQTGDDVLISGFIVGEGPGGGSSSVIIRAIGPSLTSSGVGNALQDATLELHDASGAIIAIDDNWKESQRAEIDASGIAPTNEMESAIVGTFAPGNHTAIVRGKNNMTGVALVEVYSLN